MAAILHLEDRRTLADATLTPPAVADLKLLLSDSEGRLRRRAALAMGRAGVADAVTPLSTALAKDTEPEVRAMAAFALGLIGDAAAVPALLPALGDADSRVQGRAAEALGLIGHEPAAGAIAGMAAAHVTAGALAGVAADDESYPLAPAVEAVRLGVYALARLSAVEELRAVVIGRDGLPVSDWWPLAYALQRVGKPAAAPTLRTWLSRGGSTTRAFAARGLGTLKDTASRSSLEALVQDEAQALGVRVQAMRALAAIGNPKSAPVLVPLVAKAPAAVLRLEAASALGALADPARADFLLDYLEDEWPPMRAVSQAALAKADPETFMTVLSGLDVDREWRVRAALATTLAGLGRDAAALRLGQLADDEDPKVRAAALASLATLAVPGIEARLLNGLAHADLGVRLAAARGLGTLKPAGAAAALVRAYETSTAETTYVARAAMLAALAAVDPGAAVPVLRTALSDKDWAIRVRAASLIRELDPTSTASPERPAPAPVEAGLDLTAAMIAPAISPQAYVQTTRGEIRVELAVLDAPRTVASFIALAGRGFFDGLAWHRIVPDFVVQSGDPRGDGEGGPGYTIRDELSQRPYVRGTVGMALDWKDTGGSQFFITHSPQPHLDARYTVFGRVVAGMDVVDRLEPGDRIDSVRVWDGTRWIGAVR
ncbi:MAG: HEAT repeat domain-containing protein [Acidobacteria bacterium]|nr:HEAT repeat domain-containing protein [Acidobacteriota bacterium]